MESITPYIMRDTRERIVVFETEDDTIDDQGLNDENPVMTADGKQVMKKLLR